MARRQPGEQGRFPEASRLVCVGTGPRAEAHYRQVLDVAEPRGMRPLVGHCHLGLGKLYLRTEKREQAQEHLATATRMFSGMGRTYWLERAQAQLE